jgi:cytochrome c5
MDEYLKSLQPVPSPYLENGKMSEAALRGKRVFADVDCSGCHPDPLFTNLKSYDMGTGKGVDRGVAMDTPTLIELWRTAPYLNDGGAATIREVLTGTDGLPQHGEVESLSERELHDLVQYLLSL